MPSLYTYKINYKGSSKVIKRICDKLNHWSEVMLGTTHNTAFYGDLGQTAYEHSQTTGNPHNLTLEDLGIENLPRDVEYILNLLGVSMYNWIDHDNNQMIDHDGNELAFHSEPQLLSWH